MATIYLLVRKREDKKEILGAFSDYGDAEGVRRTAPDEETFDEFNIDFFHVDAMVGWEYGPTWCVNFRNPDGEISLLETCEFFRHPTAAVVRCYPEFTRATSPISLEHAIEVATDKRDEMTMTRM